MFSERFIFIIYKQFLQSNKRGRMKTENGISTFKKKISTQIWSIYFHLRAQVIEGKDSLSKNSAKTNEHLYFTN